MSCATYFLSECACAHADRTFRFVAARTSYARVRHERACATCFIVLYARTTCGFSSVCARMVATHALRYSSYCCSFIFTKTADHCLFFLINMKFPPKKVLIEPTASLISNLALTNESLWDHSYIM